jgi:copper homeostasis protein
MMKQPLFELCAESLSAVRAAQAGGADRIELCVNLAVNGLTPTLEMMQAAISECSIPIHVLIRPRAGGFVYTEAEFKQMCEEVAAARQSGAAGIVTGVLLLDGRVDVARTAELVALARPMQVTFHKAMDAARDLSEALEAVIATGADCVLTSGGAADAEAGALRIAALHRQANGRIAIMVGGGLRLDNLLKILERAEVNMLHGSLLRRRAEVVPDRTTDLDASESEELAQDIREAVKLMRESVAGRTRR